MGAGLTLCGDLRVGPFRPGFSYAYEVLFCMLSCILQLYGIFFLLDSCGKSSKMTCQWSLLNKKQFLAEEGEIALGRILCRQGKGLQVLLLSGSLTWATSRLRKTHFSTCFLQPQAPREDFCLHDKKAKSRSIIQRWFDGEPLWRQPHPEWGEGSLPPQLLLGRCALHLHIPLRVGGGL